MANFKINRDPYRIRTDVPDFADQYLSHSVKGSVRGEGLEPSKVLPQSSVFTNFTTYAYDY